MGLAVTRIRPPNPPSQAIWLVHGGVLDSYDSVAPEARILISLLHGLVVKPRRRCLPLER